MIGLRGFVLGTRSLVLESIRFSQVGPILSKIMSKFAGGAGAGGFGAGGAPGGGGAAADDDGDDDIPDLEEFS